MDSGVDSGTGRLLGRRDGQIGWMTFNNPERRNAISLDMWAGIPRVIEAFEADPEIRVIVLAGAGEKAFVAGADISQFETSRGDAASDSVYTGDANRASAALVHTPKPTIAMIRGYCIGGGLGVALTCDLRICADDARFAIPAAKLGLGYRLDAVRELVDVVGPSYAKEILFTGRQFDAQEALAMGLVNKVVPVAELETTVRSYAGMMGQNAPLTIKASKMAVREVLRDAERRRTAEVDAAVKACFDSADFREGRRAFMEKRPPVFRGE